LIYWLLKTVCRAGLLTSSWALDLVQTRSERFNLLFLARSAWFLAFLWRSRAPLVVRESNNPSFF
jgi:hypothetical protein